MQLCRTPTTVGAHSAKIGFDANIQILCVRKHIIRKLYYVLTNVVCKFTNLLAIVVKIQQLNSKFTKGW